MATARTEVDMIVKATAKGFKELGGDMKTLTAATEKAGTGFKVAGLSLTDFSSGVGLAQQGLRVLGDGLESLKQGAAAKQTAESFGFLVDKVGGAVNTLELMREATRGTVDDMTLMSSTLTLTAGAGDDLAKRLFDAAPQLAEIAKASNKLNPALGDTAFLMESLGTGVKRASPLILDNLGLTIKVGDANEKFAASIGKTVEQLSGEEKQIAILNATLAAGGQLIEQVGGSVDAAGDSIARFETRVENITTGLKVMAVDAVLPTVDGLDALAVLLDPASTKTQQLETALAGLTSAYGENNQKTIIVRQALEDWKAGLARARDETIGYRSDMEAMAEVYGEAGTAIDATTQSISGMSGAMRETISATDLLAAGSQKLTQQFIFQQAAQGLSADAAIQLGVAMGVLNADTIAVASSIDELKTKYDANADGAISGAESAAGFAREVQKLGASVAELQDREITITVNTILSEIRQDLGEVGESPIAGRLQHGGTIPPNQPAILHPPEVLFNPQSGTTTVMSQSDTQRMLQNMEGGGARITIRNLTINASGAAEGRAAADVFMARLGADFRAHQGAGQK